MRGQRRVMAQVEGRLGHLTPTFLMAVASCRSDRSLAPLRPGTTGAGHHCGRKPQPRSTSAGVHGALGSIICTYGGIAGVERLFDHHNTAA